MPWAKDYFKRGIFGLGLARNLAETRSGSQPWAEEGSAENGAKDDAQPGAKDDAQPDPRCWHVTI